MAVKFSRDLEDLASVEVNGLKAESGRLAEHAYVQRALFRYMFFHPDSSLKDASKKLGISYGSAKVAWHRLRSSHELARLCPLCFNESFDGSSCHLCGFTYDRQEDPVHDRPYRGEGHETVIMLKGEGLNLKANARKLQNIIDHGFKGHKRERKLEHIRALLDRELMDYPHDASAEAIAERILINEYRMFMADYPELLRKHGVEAMIVRKVIKHLRPWLAPISAGYDGVTRLHKNEAFGDE